MLNKAKYILLAFYLFYGSGFFHARALTYAEISGQGKVLSDSAISSCPYSTGALVNDSGTVYFISGINKVPFANWQAFIGLGYNPINIVDGNLTSCAFISGNTINTPNDGHPWGSWLIYKGTIYYSTQAGMVGVPSEQVFASNGGNWTHVLKANQRDIALLNLSANLPVLTVNDSRILTTGFNSIQPPISSSPVFANALVFSGSSAVRVCVDNCASLPEAIFKVCPASQPDCSPKNHYTISLFFENKPLVTFATPIIVVIPKPDSGDYSTTDNFVVTMGDSKGTVTHPNYWYYFNGTNKITVYQDNFSDGSKPLAFNIGNLIDNPYFSVPEDRSFNLQTFKTSGSSGNVTVVKWAGSNFSNTDFSNTVSTVDKITRSIDNLAGKQHINFDIYHLPSLITLACGGGESCYYGNGKIIIGSGTKDITEMLDEITQETAHEYSHVVEFERGPFGQNSGVFSGHLVSGNTSAFIEGLADAGAVYLGDAQLRRLDPGISPLDGCVIQTQDPHVIGRCIFQYLYQAGLFSDNFFRTLYNPSRNYYFSNGMDLSNRNTCDTYNVIFSDASGQDLTNFMLNKIKGNCSSTLNQAKAAL